MAKCKCGVRLTERNTLHAWGAKCKWCDECFERFWEKKPGVVVNELLEAGDVRVRPGR